MEIGKRSRELDGKGEGATKRGCFYYFFSSYGWERKKYQNSDSIPAQINVCSIPASRGRLGQADLKGQGEERVGRGGDSRRDSGGDSGGGGMPRQKGLDAGQTCREGGGR